MQPPVPPSADQQPAALHEAAQQLVDDFGLFGSWEERYGYVIELGQDLPEMDEALKTDASKVRGCISQVWLAARPSEVRPGAIEFIADSDAHIVRGIVAILLQIYSERTPVEIAETDALDILGRLGLEAQLSPNRRSGLVAMVTRIHQISEQFAEHDESVGCNEGRA